MMLAMIANYNTRTWRMTRALTTLNSPHPTINHWMVSWSWWDRVTRGWTRKLVHQFRGCLSAMVG